MEAQRGTDSANERATLQKTLGRFASAALSALILLATAEAVMVAWRAGSEGVFLYWLSTLAAGSWVALALAALVSCLVFFAGGLRGRLSPGVHTLLRGLAWGGLGALLLLFLLRIWDLEEDRYHLRVLVPLLCALAGVLLSFLWTRLSAKRWSALLFFGAGLAFLADALVLPGLYLGFHNAAFACALVFAFLARLPGESGGLGPWGLILCVAAQLTLFQDMRRERGVGEASGVVQPKLIGALHFALDRDRDGFSALLGGGDCDDSSSAVFPGQCEIGGNGVDENCNGLDGAEMPERAIRGRPETELRVDVYLVLIDALRGDYGGQEREKGAPEIDRFAARSLDFRAAYTPYPSTYRALLSIMQGRYWRYTGREHPTLLQVFARRGYDVQLWIREARLVEEAFGPGIVAVSRGDQFHVPRTEAKKSWTRDIVDDALEELEKEGPPRLRWLHFLDPHAPHMRGESGVAPLERYRAELRHASGEFGRLVQGLAESERGRGAVVILLSDHGEEFGEHAGAFHGATLFEENTRVPLIMHLPGVSPRAIAGPSSLLDLLPTLYSYVGIEGGASLQGHNYLGQRPAPKARVLSEIASVDNLGGIGLPALHMVMSGKHKLVANLTANLYDYYDLAIDPLEQSVRYESNEEERLLQTLAEWQDLEGCR